MRENSIRILCSVLKTDMVCEMADGSLTAFFDATEDSPLMHSEALRRELRRGSLLQSYPYLFKGNLDAYFAALRAGEGTLYMGPMCHSKLNAVQRRQLARSYEVSTEDLRTLPVFTLPEIRNMLLLCNTVLENASLENEELLQLNRIIQRNETEEGRSQTAYVLHEEEVNDDQGVRHSYRQEQMLMQAISEGRTQEAVRLAEEMDQDSGRLSKDEVRHRRNLAIVGIALCARAAISGGISPESAYRISGYYIEKCDTAQDPAHMLHFRNRAIEELSGRVAERLNRSANSNHVEQCKDYIRQHYREKLYLEEIADALGISPTYLSRLFRKETGQCLQDFINEERVTRAANLLLYSDLSLPEIAQYVHFPNQSYFGKVFKKTKGMTPKAFRDLFRPTENPSRHGDGRF